MVKANRTEEQIVARASVMVILGGKEYGITPLVIRDSREWRQKVIKLIAPLPQLVSTTLNVNDPGIFEGALTQMLVTMPEQVADLFFQYAKDLDREEIEGIATDEELAKAFEEVSKLAFPLAESLPKVMARLSQ